MRSSGYYIGLLIAISLLSSCAQQSVFIDRGNYIAKVIPNKQVSNDCVKYLVMHYTALDDERSLKVLTGGRVSSHYLIPTHPSTIDNKPVVISLVDERQIAWHAGISQWGEATSLNNCSIGIEIVNLGYRDNGKFRYWYSYTADQIVTISMVMKDIIDRYDIEPQNVLGHSDIAPLRKVDPGPLFPWERLASQGIGAWPDKQLVQAYLADRDPSEPVDVANFQTLLQQYGYQTPTNGVLDDKAQKVVKAFQMHFRSTKANGIPDAQSEAILKALIDKYRA
ncbi:N-acetylmuramoyl-L-alanine amidase [Proteus sp. FME41]|uniref:N-acetylmuramoyl-L-alanine amidase n=1 Tax=Proteus sp. FME41 TaxID=2742608 RepID=UPI001868ACD9|nr:N-acetylmuramoyl-L-alanine amidase [Proteus sp. FME41]